MVDQEDRPRRQSRVFRWKVLWRPEACSAPEVCRDFRLVIRPDNKALSTCPIRPLRLGKPRPARDIMAGRTRVFYRNPGAGTSGKISRPTPAMAS